MSPKKYYVVWKGRKTGIFTNWEECKKQVNGFAGARYKSFKSRAEAEQAFSSNSEQEGANLEQKPGSAKRSPSKSPSNKKIALSSSEPIADSIAVDASCLGNPGDLEYRGVDTATGEVLFQVGPLSRGTNNIGEFLAIVHALGYLKKLDSLIPVYSDSKVAMLWVKQKKIRTTLKQTPANAELFELIDRATSWLQNNDYPNPILKWDTKVWGEIPADFGRK
ncbi:MAG: ribonuclease H [Oscillatoria sp. SIO1A7]|nr:ribonuclease H [Oscillatoria sp. SIO1A7]